MSHQGGILGTRTEPVAGGGLIVRDVPLGHYVDRVWRRSPFSHAKINHGFWERAVQIRREGFDDSPAGRQAMDRRTFGAPYMLEGGFWDEFVEQLRRWPTDDPDLALAVSPFAYDGSLVWGGTPPNPVEVSRTIAAMLPPGFEPEDGLTWKRAVIDGSIRAFFEAIVTMPTVLVGPSHLAEAAGALGGGRVIHHAIHSSDARLDRGQILEDLRALHPQFGGEPVAYLFQAATLSVWLIAKLHRTLENAFLIDLGRALDIFVPSVVTGQNWARLFRDELRDGWGLVVDPTFERRRAAASDAIARLTGPEPAPAAPMGRGPIPFVQSKGVEPERPAVILGASRRANQWSNFGPVSRELERALHEYLGLPGDRAVVACSSGSSALHAMVRLREHEAGRRLRWLTSAFSFPCALQGPLSGAIVVDSDATGQMDLSLLRSLDPSSFDGVIATNVFGMADAMPAVAEWCRTAGKALIFDSAAAFDHGMRAPSGFPAEIVSFHHTKPWGFGEGGFAILDRSLERTFRSLINFGLCEGEPTGSASANGKLSDVSAAYILAWLERFPTFEDRYRFQYQRVARLAEHLGLRPLVGSFVPDDRWATPACCPLVVPEDRQVPTSMLENSTLTLRKYYVPLADRPVAASVFRRILNVPCHPDLANVSHDDLARTLGRIRDEAPAWQSARSAGAAA